MDIFLGYVACEASNRRICDAELGGGVTCYVRVVKMTVAVLRIWRPEREEWRFNKNLSAATQ